MTGDDPEVPIRPAATLILARDSPRGPQVLMLERHPRSVFVGGAHVFPGGAVDALDYDPAVHRLCTASKARDLAWRVAAVRECFEEAGVLMACQSGGARVWGETPQSLESQRRQLMAGDLDLSGLCHQQQLQLNTGDMHYYSRWVTPPGPPRRYDTRFYFAEAPAGQQATACQQETVSHCWIRPAGALDRWHQQQISLVLPTVVTLQELADFDSVHSLLAHCRLRAEQQPDTQD